MIIFDTSVLFGLRPDDSKLALLRALGRSGRQQVAIPWMVREELVARQVLRHAEAHAGAVAAAGALNRAAPWAREPGPAPFDRDAASGYWREEYGRLFEVIETSGGVALQALQREANCRKPAKGPEARDKGGARDAAIWLSVVDYLKGHPGEEVCFVTGNTRDFGDGTELPAPMNEDVKDVRDRLRLLTSFDAVVSEFTAPLEIGQHVKEDLIGLLTSGAAVTPLARSVWDQRLSAPGSGTFGQGARFFWALRLGGPDDRRVVLRSVQDVAGHKIGEDSWYTATADWILVTRDTSPYTAALAEVLAPRPALNAFQWRSRLLFSSNPGEGLTFLRHRPVQALDPSARAEWEPLVREALPQSAATSQLADTIGSSPSQDMLEAFAEMVLAGEDPKTPENQGRPGPAA